MTNHTAADLPDDPRECCRAAISVMVDAGFEDQMLEAGDAIEIAGDALANLEGTPLAEELTRMLDRASKAMKSFTAKLGRVQELVRHGTGDHCEWDRHRAEFLKATAEGREPPALPYEPTVHEVSGAMAAATAMGQPMSEDEAITLLKRQHAA